MTIQEYISKIDVLQNNTSAFFEDAVLELCIRKLQMNCIEFSFTLNDVFRKSDYQQINLNTDLLKQLADYLGLLFINEQESGNVCFANDVEVRPEFKQSIRLIDLLDYIYAFLHSSFYKKSQKIIMPSDTGFFWKMVQIGSGFRIKA